MSDFRMEHNCIMVTDVDRTVRFYDEVFGLKVLRRKEGSDREIVFLGTEPGQHQIEVIHMNGRTEPIDLGENPTHLAFRAVDIAAARECHEKMGIFHHELPEFGVYFVADPDGYLCEVMPTRK